MCVEGLAMQDYLYDHCQSYNYRFKTICMCYNIKTLNCMWVVALCLYYTVIREQRIFKYLWALNRTNIIFEFNKMYEEIYNSKLELLVINNNIHIITLQCIKCSTVLEF